MKIQKFNREQREEPSLCYCDRDINLTPGACYGPVIRDIYIIECCTAGYGSVIINGVEFSVKPGDCYILLPGDTIIHTADFKEPRSGVWCAADGLQIGRCLARAGITSAQPYAPAAVFEEITAQLEELIAMKGEQDPGAELRRTACIYRILGALLRNSAKNDTDSLIQKAIDMMEARFDQPLPVETLAASVGLERCYFSTLFKEQTGLSPHRYLNSLRIRKACTLLKQSDCSIASAAETVGLDPQNFARLFKQELGITPLKYKKIP